MSPLYLTPLEMVAGSRLLYFGHSLAAGFAQTPDKEVLVRLASAFRMLEIPFAVNGGVLQSNNTATVNRGGFNTVGNAIKKKPYPSGTVRTGFSAGSRSSFDVSDPVDGPWRATELVSIGTGANAELSHVSGLSGSAGSYVLNLARPISAAHAAGEPVVSVPSIYETPEPLYFCWWGINDLAWNGSGTLNSGTVGTGEKTFKEVLKTVVARLCSGGFFEANSGAFARSTNAATTAAAGLSLGTHLRALNTVGHQFTWDVPANFSGGDLFVTILFNSGAGGELSFTLDGAAHAPNLDTRNNGKAGFYVPFVKIFKDVPAGRHTIVGTVLATSGQTFLNGAGIVAERPPVVGLIGFNKPPSYDIWTAASWAFGHAVGTVNANHPIGTTSFTITAPLDSQGATIPLKRGEPITFGAGTANEETLEINADASSTTVVTTAASTKAHDTGEAYQGNIHDAAVDRALDWIPDLLATGDLPDTVLHVPIVDAVGSDAEDYAYDGVHFNDRLAALVAEEVADVLRDSGKMTQELAIRTSTPVAPLPGPVYFLGPTKTAVSGDLDPGGAGVVTEAFTDFRQSRDCRRVRQARLNAVVSTASSGAARARVEYSIDSQVTWKTLGRRPNFADTDIATASEVGQIDINTIGQKNTGWFVVPSELWYVTDVWFRYVHGNRDAGTTDPVYTSVVLEFS